MRAQPQVRHHRLFDLAQRIADRVCAVGGSQDAEVGRRLEELDSLGPDDCLAAVIQGVNSSVVMSDIRHTTVLPI